MKKQFNPNVHPHNVLNTDLAYCTPYVNINGNSRKQLAENTYKIIESLGNVMESIARSDLNHGRNAMTKEHDVDLKESITNDINTIRDLSTKYNGILDNIIQDSDGEFFKF